MEAGACGKNSACHLTNACETAVSNKSGLPCGLPETPWENETSAPHSQAEDARIEITDKSGNEVKPLDEDHCDPAWPEETPPPWRRDSEGYALEGKEDSETGFATIAKVSEVPLYHRKTIIGDWVSGTGASTSVSYVRALAIHMS